MCAADSRSAAAFLMPQQLLQGPGAGLPRVGAIRRDVRQPHQQRLDALVAVERHRQIDRLAHLAGRDVGGGHPPFQVVEQHGGVARLPGDALVERQDLHQLRLGDPRGRHQRARAFEIAVLLQRVAQAGDARRARLRPRQLQRGGAVQRLRGGARAARLRGAELEDAGHALALRLRRILRPRRSRRRRPSTGTIFLPRP